MITLYEVVGSSLTLRVRSLSLDSWRDLALWIHRDISLENGHPALRRYDLFFNSVLLITNLVFIMNNSYIQKKRKIVISYSTCTPIGGLLGSKVQDWMSILVDFYDRSVHAYFSVTLSRNSASNENKMTVFWRMKFVVDGRIINSHYTLHILRATITRSLRTVRSILNSDINIHVCKRIAAFYFATFLGAIWAAHKEITEIAACKEVGAALRRTLGDQTAISWINTSLVFRIDSWTVYETILRMNYDIKRTDYLLIPGAVFEKTMKEEILSKLRSSRILNGAVTSAICGMELASVFKLCGLIGETINAELTVDARGTVEDDIRNVFHSIGATSDQEIFAAFTHIVDALFDDNLMIGVCLNGYHH